MKGLKHKIGALTLAASILFCQSAYANIAYVAELPSEMTETTDTSGATKYITIRDGTVYGLNSDNSRAGNVIGPGASIPGNNTTDSNAIGPMAGDTGGPGSSNPMGGGNVSETDLNNPTTGGSFSDPSASNTALQNQEPEIKTITVYDTIEKPQISAEAAVLYDAATGQVLFEKNSAEHLAPASMTKLMTALLAVERLSPDAVITFNSSAVDNLESGATTAGMKAGDTMNYNDALHALLIRSACEVANAIGEAVAGSQENFVALMNQKAAELGCTNTNFKNCSGLNDDSHYSSAADIAAITRAALSNETIRNITLKKNYTLPATDSRSSLTITNTCKFISGGTEELEGYQGGKTGYTSKAGSCLTSKAVIGGREFVVTVLKATAPNQYSDTRALYNYARSLMTVNGLMTDADNSSGQAGSNGTSDPGTSTNNSYASAGSIQSGVWERNTDAVRYKKADGTYCTNEWLDLDGNSYFFDSDSKMCIGWKKFTNGSWYYFNPENGAMVTNKWVAQDGKSYYLQSDGVMATNTVINGMYRVDGNGVYVEKVG